MAIIQTITGIHYVHKYRTNSATSEQFPCFLCSFLYPFCSPLLTWNPPCCDRIRPPQSQVARKLISPFPHSTPYTPHSEILTPWGFPELNIHFTKTTSRTWVTRSSTISIVIRLDSFFFLRSQINLKCPVFKFSNLWNSYLCKTNKILALKILKKKTLNSSFFIDLSRLVLFFNIFNLYAPKICYKKPQVYYTEAN